MGSSALIYLILAVALVATLPVWQYSRLWGGGKTPSVFIAVLAAIHTYTVLG